MREALRCINLFKPTAFFGEENKNTVPAVHCAIGISGTYFELLYWPVIFIFLDDLTDVVLGRIVRIMFVGRASLGDFVSVCPTRTQRCGTSSVHCTVWKHPGGRSLRLMTTSMITIIRAHIYRKPGTKNKRLVGHHNL